MEEEEDVIQVEGKSQNRKGILNWPTSICCLIFSGAVNDALAPLSLYGVMIPPTFRHFLAPTSAFCYRTQNDKPVVPSQYSLECRNRRNETMP